MTQPATADARTRFDQYVTPELDLLYRVAMSLTRKVGKVLQTHLDGELDDERTTNVNNDSVPCRSYGTRTVSGR